MSDVKAGVLSATVEALGKVMLEMQRRRLLLSAGSPRAREFIERSRPALTDEQVGNLAADAFEAGALELARVGYPGAAAVHSCNPSEEHNEPR